MTSSVVIVARGLTAGGTGRAIQEILTAANRLRSLQGKVTIISDDQRLLDSLPNLASVYIPPANKLWWDNVLLTHRLKLLGAEAVIYTKNIIPPAHWLAAWKKSIVVYDLAFYHPKLKAYRLLDTWYMALLLPFSVWFADSIFCISKFTAAELEKFCQAPERKIHILPLGVNPAFRRKSLVGTARLLQKHNLRRPFIFYCGSLSPRKNLPALLESFIQEKKSRHWPHTLYLVSGRGWNVPSLEKFRGCPDVVFLPHIAENELVSLYSLAEAFVYPSLYEGFGLPILEAQACGCPVMTSRTAACPEAAGGAAVLVNPLSRQSLRRGLRTLIEDQPVRRKLVSLGLKNAASHRWGKTASTLLVNV